MPKATILDVADLAGVSFKTVSRVINKEPNVRKSTRDKVQAAIDSLGYHPSSSARSLAGNRSYIIGLLYDNPSANYVIDVQTGVLPVCRSEGYGLLIHPCDHQDKNLQAEISGLVHQSRVDGLILTPPLSDMDSLLQHLQAQHTPFIRIAPATSDERSSCVMTNDREAAFAMTQTLIDKGHRRIGFINGHPNHKAMAMRLEGYRDALKHHGIKETAGLIVQGYNSLTSGVLCARQLLALSPRPTAIFAANDDMAAGVIKVAHQQGLRIPEKIAVAGFDDTPAAEHIWPSLSTVKQPICDMSREAARLLLQQLRSPPGSYPHCRIDSQLILRESL